MTQKEIKALTAKDKYDGTVKDIALELLRRKKSVPCSGEYICLINSFIKTLYTTTLPPRPQNCKWRLTIEYKDCRLFLDGGLDAKEALSDEA